ncbi:spotted leaf 11 [Musa troglodytarum]|uniref:Spotted leaf 11 n=1 Tax=Musa troglodytarum TaxID=320322 RepID=A0A9E7FF00_9LILI|nr:spotted leaf 11 [Musa troglodytarum]URD94016.1 spotted leaf 11 [Musa troglodytarum]
MAKCARLDAASFRLWLAFFPSLLRRRLLQAVACGAYLHRGRRGSCGGAGFNAAEQQPRRTRPGGSERLAELLRAESSDDSGSDEAPDDETRRKVESFEELRCVVGCLQLDGHSAGEDRREEAAAEVRRLAKDDPGARETLAMLGVIPPLVGMLDSDDPGLHIAALYALLNLGIGNELNKAAVVKAGAVHKMLNLIESDSSALVSEAIVANFLGLSALDSNKPIIGASGAIPILLSAFRSPDTSPTARQDAVRALFNLSIASVNLPLLVDAGLVPALLEVVGDMAVSERILALLSNLVAAGEGRRALSGSTDAFAILVDVLGWSDAIACQEKAAYILMVMAHKCHADRAAMLEAGVVSVLLELTLLGTPLAQKRASRLLDILTMDKGKRVSENGGRSGVPAVSAPLCGGASEASRAEAEAKEGMSEERRAVVELVHQSLQTNMLRIVRRANLPQDFAPSERLRALTATSTTKSLPF